MPALTSIALAPEGTRDWLGEAVERGGATIVEVDAANGLVWTDPADPAGLGAVLDAHPGIEWVQLPWAGIEPYVEVVRAHADRTWTCGKGVYAEPVAEHALALALAGMRQVGRYARATAWSRGTGVNLLGARVVVLGGGGITESLLRLLGPFDCDITVVRRTPQPMDGAHRVVGDDGLDGALQGAALVVLALALTPATTGVLDRRRLELLAPDAWVVNVARGAHVVTDDLVAVLAEGRIGGAALDVTDPEPLPEGHPLWAEPRCIITPHTANTIEMAIPLLGARVQENVRRRIAGELLLGPVDPAAGY
ncbi:MAG: NAD(P)-dependent oxidoreductase [Acidimicrobiales bacterium]